MDKVKVHATPKFMRRLMNFYHSTVKVVDWEGGGERTSHCQGKRLWRSFFFSLSSLKAIYNPLFLDYNTIFTLPNH